VPLQADWVLGTGQPINIHTGAGRQCADATEAGVGADGPALIHTGKGSMGLWKRKGRDEAAYVMPDWAGRTNGKRDLFNSWCSNNELILICVMFIEQPMKLLKALNHICLLTTAHDTISMLF